VSEGFGSFTTTIELVNFPGFEAKLRGIAADLRTAGSRRATLAGAQVFEAGMKLRAREAGIMDTGNLISGIVSQNVSDEEAVASVTADYAVYNEYGTGIYASFALGANVGGGPGICRQTPWTYYNARWGHCVTTRGMRPRPFVRPTLDQDKETAVDAVVDELEQTVAAAL
jgi:HK97 gp10 family phage protein